MSPITLGLPGVLPKLNKKVVESAVKLGLATNCSITHENRFARKNYFYPDLPKGFQLTQDKTPICRNGFVDVEVAGQPKRVLIHHIHMEEDAGKSIHDEEVAYSWVDLNRAGTPLLEIVSEPCLHSGDEAFQYLYELRRLVRFLGISDGNMEQGSLRCDVNISVREKGQTQLGTKVEIKNMNSMRFVKQAIEHEWERQVHAIESGETIVQQTRLFDVSSGTTAPMRDKEDAHDYRYFPEPDLPPVVLSEAYIDDIRAGMPALPQALYRQFVEEYQLSTQDASVITSEKDIADYFQAIIEHTSEYKAAANWLMGPIKAWQNASGRGLSDFPVPPKSTAEVIDLVRANKLSSSAAQQQLFPKLIEQPNSHPEQLAEALQLFQSEDEDFLNELVENALQKHADKIELYRNGKKGLFGVFMSEIMKGSNGRANPKAATALLRQKLENTES